MLVHYITVLAIFSRLAQSGPLWNRQDHNQTLAQQLEEIRKAHSLPSLIVGMTSRTQGTETHAVGLRKLGSPIQMQTTDSFHLGSNTKAMTSTLLSTYIDQGHLASGWDTTLLAAHPTLATQLPSIHHNLTLAQIASHRSGLNSLPLLTIPLVQSLYNLSGPTGRESLIKAIATQPQPNNATQGVYLYDNINYMLLGAVIDHLAGTSTGHWEGAIQTRIFRPLGMRCAFGVPWQSSESAIDNPIGHLLQTTNSTPVPIDSGPLAQRDYPPAYGPAGTVNCDMKSYMRFLQLHVDGARAWSSSWSSGNGNGNGTGSCHPKGPAKLYISPSSFKRMHTPYPTVTADDTQYTPGGWLWYNSTATRDWAGGWTLAHVGSNPMFLATAVVAPFYGRTTQRQRGAGFVGATNVGDALDGKSAEASGGTAEGVEALIYR